MTEPEFSLDADVRRAEPDLWLSSRLVADPLARDRLIALYAVHADLGRVAGAASNPLAGEIRLAWWREESEAMLAAARPLGHPALQALAGAGEGAALGGPLDAMIEARHGELEPRPFADETALVAYLDGVDGGLMRAAAAVLAPDIDAPLIHTGRAWGWARLLRERAAWRGRGRDWSPLAWGEASEVEIVSHIGHRVADALKAARGEIIALPTPAFPAVAYAALAAAYAQGRAPNELEVRARLLWASLRGRI